MNPSDLRNEIVNIDGVYKQIETRNEIIDGYTMVSKMTREVSPFDIFNIEIKKSKKILTSELKDVIDKIITLGGVDISFSNKAGTNAPMIYYTIHEEHYEATEYLFKFNPDLGDKSRFKLYDYIRGLISTSTSSSSRFNFIELVLKNAPNNWVTTLQYTGKLFKVQYLVMVINSGKLAPNVLENAYSHFKRDLKKKLVLLCPDVQTMAIILGDEEFYPESIKDVFLF